ncbi:MAG: hypothetical protein HY927_09910 [Elusimicrobia bacterium]|nr:hypothetical protein [Elusimicrobiota bacterium]
MDLDHLSDDELRGRLRCLSGHERRLLADLLRHLAQADKRRASDGWGFPSLFAYCTEELRYSEASAYKRITAARAAARCPALLDLLEGGRTHLEAILILAPHLTEDNAADLLARADGKSKREVEVLVAELAPRPDIRDCVMRLPDPAALPGHTSPSVANLAGASSALIAPASPSAPVGDPAAPPNGDGTAIPSWPALPAASPTAAAGILPARETTALARERLRPLSPGRVHFGFTGSESLRAKLERIRDLLLHKHPGGRLEDVIGEMAEVFLDAKDPERRAIRREARRRSERRQEARWNAPGPDTGGPAAARTDRAIPQAVRAQAWIRDGGRCAFVAKDGRRCAQRGGLEFDHIIPRALGGPSGCVDNVRLLCRAHNQFAARECFGPGLVGPHRRNSGTGGRKTDPGPIQRNERPIGENAPRPP